MKYESAEHIRLHAKYEKSRKFVICLSKNPSLHLELTFLLAEISLYGVLFHTRNSKFDNYSSGFLHRTWRHRFTHMSPAWRCDVTAICGATPSSEVLLPFFRVSSTRANARHFCGGGSGFCPRVYGVVHPRGPIQ